MSKPYNGHKNYNHWNVSLWMHNDETLYREAVAYVREERNKDKAAALYLDWLRGLGITKTPDGAPYTLSSVRAALTGLE